MEASSGPNWLQSAIYGHLGIGFAEVGMIPSHLGGWLAACCLFLGLGQPWFFLTFLLYPSRRLAQDYSWQRKQSKGKEKPTRQAISSATFYWPKQVQGQSRLGNRLQLLRGGTPKSYYEGHGHKKWSKTAAIFAID